MKLLMPSHVRRVKQHYADPVPLFQRHGVEDQLGAMYQPVVQLKSGGYLVINPTEALVSIDINSGRSTREHNIEQTASHQHRSRNEIARQLRLRDMAGLSSSTSSTWNQSSHVRKVEKAMKEALKNDRARIQVGRISELRPDGNEPAAAPHRRARGFDQGLPALRRHGPDAHRAPRPACRRCG
jgi:ribonuclease E